jgi:hypothetical protein
MWRSFRVLFAAIALISLSSLAIGTALAAHGGGGHGGGGHGGGGAHFGGGGGAHFGGMGFGGARAGSFGVAHFGGPRFGVARFHRGPFVGLGFRHGRRFFGPGYYYGPYYHHRCWVRRLVRTPWGWHWRLFNRCRYHHYWRYY